MATGRGLDHLDTHKISEEATRSVELDKILRIGLEHTIPEQIENDLKKSASRSGSLRIVDVTCGTGSWLVEATNTLKPYGTVQADGFDSSSAQFPQHRSETDSTFHVLDVTDAQELPSEYNGQYDLVAVRLLHIWLSSEQWDRTMQNLTKLLKPGGYLYWVDWDPLTVRVAATKPGAPDARTRDIFRRYTDVLRDRKVGNTYAIPKLMEAHGLEDVDSDMYPVPPSFAFTQNLTHGALRYLTWTGTLSKEEAEALRKDVDEELTAQGSLLWYDLWCHTARKRS